MPIGKRDAVFSSSALEPEDLVVVSVRGREAMSELFEFEIVLDCTVDGGLDFDQIDQMMDGTAWLGFGPASKHKVFGVLRAVDLMPVAAPGSVRYRALLVPRLWYTTLEISSRVYQDLSVPEIVEAVLKDSGMASGEHYELRVSAKHPKREYTVQYQETDYAFISRLMEYEGICFFFEHGEKGDMLVIADANSAYAPLAGFENIPYRPVQGMASTQLGIRDIVRTRNAIPAQITLQDYNYRTPTVLLREKAPVDPKGRGLQTFYGDHFKDASDGKRVAKLRAEEAAERKISYTGISAVQAMHPGQKFSLEEHFIAGFNQAYVVTEVNHEVRPEGEPRGGSDSGVGYTNRFTAQQFDTPFRPVRKTPWPRIHGIIYGKIDASGTGTAAPIDSQGRYKVMLPFDTAATKAGQTSRWIRMAQHYSGPGYGTHFPLHKGTEVLVAHVDGDPDRPIILSAAPNTQMVSPVAQGNATQSVIRTHAGIHMEFEDDA